MSLEGLTDISVILKDHGEDIDLSDKWISVEITDSILPSAIITLNTTFGNYTTRAPIIKYYDRIYIRIEDKNGNVFSEVFHVKQIDKQRKARQGKQIILTCPHQSSNLWTRTVSFFKRGFSGAEALDECIRQLNLPKNKGANDPSVHIPDTFDIVTKQGNNLNRHTANFYNFKKMKLKQALDEIARIEARPIEAGGSFQPPYIRFTSRYNPLTRNYLDEVVLQAYAQGFKAAGQTFRNIPSVTLTHGVIGDNTTNTLENTSNETPERATNLHIIGDAQSGTLLVDHNKYFAAREAYDVIRYWDIDSDYKYGDKVRYDGIVYECIIDITLPSRPPPNNNWIARPFGVPLEWNSVTNYIINSIVAHNKICYKSLINGNSDLDPAQNSTSWQRINFLPPCQYSPETKGLKGVQNFLNACGGARYASVNNGRCATVDPNIVVSDVYHPRTFVRLVGDNPNQIPRHLLNSDGNVPDAFRMLVCNPTYTPNTNLATATIRGLGLFSGNDRNGLPYAGNVAEYVDPDHDGTGEWLVHRQRILPQDQEIYDFEQGLGWIKFHCNTLVNQSGLCILGGTRGEGFVSGAYKIAIDSGGASVGLFEAGLAFPCVHSVAWDSDRNHVDMGNKQLVDDDIDGNSGVYIKSQVLYNNNRRDHVNTAYVGFNFWTLSPCSSLSTPFASVETGEFLNNPTFSFANFFRNHLDEVDWFGPNSEDYHPIQSYVMWMEFIDNFPGSNSLFPSGDYTINTGFVDRNDQAKVSTYDFGKNRDILPAAFPLPGDVWKGVPGAAYIFNAKQPNNADVFNPDEVLLGMIFTGDSFDSTRRYKPRTGENYFTGTGSRFFTTRTLEMAIDMFRRTKKLTATNADEETNLPSRNIETLAKDYSRVFSYNQLKNIALGEAQYENFQHQEVKIDSDGRFDIKHGDPVYYKDTEGIPDTTNGLTNTLLMVCDKTVITLNKIKDGPGGIKTKFHLITRLYP